MLNTFFHLKTHTLHGDTESVDISPAEPGNSYGGLDTGVTSGGTFGGGGGGGYDPGLSRDALASTRAPGAPDLLEGPPTLDEQNRSALAEFSAFSEQLDSFAEQFGATLGLGPELTAGVKRGAELADPEAFSRGVKTGVGFELASAFAGLTGLPTSVAVGILDRTVAAFANPAFRAGRESINNPLGTLAPVVGTAAGLSAGSIGLARALELGVNVAGIATQVPESLRGEVPTTPATERGTEGSEQARDSGRLAQREPTRQPALGARITTSTDQDFERLRSELRPRESFSRADLRVAAV